MMKINKYKVGQTVTMYNKPWTVESINGDYMLLSENNSGWITEVRKDIPLPTKKWLTLKPTW